VTSRRVFIRRRARARHVGFAPSFSRSHGVRGQRDGRPSGSSRSFSAARSMAQHDRPLWRRGLLPLASEHCHRAYARRRQHGDRPRRLFWIPSAAPSLKPWWDAQQLAVIDACGSPGARAIDAQVYMETADTGREEQVGRWLNRYLQAHHVEHTTPFRRRRPGLADSTDASGYRTGTGRDTVRATWDPVRPGKPRHQRLLKPRFAAAATASSRHGTRGIRSHQMLKWPGPIKLSARPTARTTRAPFGQL